MKSSAKRLRLFMIALFTCIACVCLVIGVTACSSSSKSSGAIELSDYSITISEEETYTLKATATDKDGGAYTGNYVWTKDGDAIDITISGDICIVTGLSTGMGSVTVTAGSFSATCTVTVKAKETPTGTTSVKSVSVTPKEMPLYVGDTGIVTASLEIAEGTTYIGDYVWESSDEKVATVSKNNDGSCTVTAVGAGEAEITVTVGDEKIKATCTVTVTEDTIESITLSESTVEVYTGITTTITATVNMKSGKTSDEFTYEIESEPENAVTVTKDGNTLKIEGVTEGTATITVTAAKSITATCEVTVIGDTVESIELSEKVIEIATEGTAAVTATVNMKSGTTSDEFTYEVTSEPEGAVTVTKDGNTLTIVGVTEGKATITVTAAEGITDTCEVTVVAPVAESIALSSGSVTLGLDSETTVVVTVTMSNGKTSTDFSFENSDTSVITVTKDGDTLTIKSGTTEGTAAITVTAGSLSETIKVTVSEITENPANIHIDFSNSDTYSWMDTTFTKESSNGIISIPVSSKTTIGQEMENSLNTGGAASASNGRYFVLDLSGYVGSVVTITVTMCSNKDNDPRSLLISTTVTTSGALATATSSAKDANQLVTLYYSTEITEATKILYITCDASVNIFTIDVEIQDASEVVPEVQSVTISPSTLTLKEGETGTLTAAVTMNIGDYEGEYEWMLSDGGIIEITWVDSVATVTAVAAGTVTVTVKAGGKEATCTVTVKEEGTASQEESFIVPIAGSEEGLSSDSFSSGSAITDNSLFTVTADVSMKYYGGKQGGSGSSPNSLYGALQDGSNAVSFTDMSGTTHNPDQGIQVSSGIAAGETVDSILTVTVKEDIQLYVYVSWANDGYSSNKSGTIFYSVDGGEKVENSLTARKTIWTISVELSADQTLVIGATNNESSDSAKLWFFGAEAKLLDGTTGGGTSGNTEFEEDPDYEWIDSYADLETALGIAGGSGSSYKTKEDLEVGKFTFGTGVYFENSNSNFTDYGVYDVNNQQKNIYFAVSGTYNNISFRAVESSGSQGTITLYTQSGAVLYTWTVGQGATVIVNYATDTGSYLAPGTYYIGSVNSFRMGQMYVSEYLQKSPVTGITVKATTVDFLKGRSVTGIDLGISATLDYENGRQDTINLSDLVIEVPTTLNVGANTVTVTYNYTGDSGTSTPYTKDVTIYVYYVLSIGVTTVSMEYTNSTYITHNLQQVFLLNGSFNCDYIVVTATCSCGVTGIADMEFILKESEYNVTTPDLSSKGEKTITVSCNLGQTEGDPKTDTYAIHVVEITSSIDRAKVQVYNTSDTENTATYEADTETGIISVSTINDAIKLLELMGATDAERKYIYVGAGEYWEKIYIDMPNLSLIGSNTVATDDDGNMVASRSEETVIVYDAMNGVIDPSGTTTFSTVGSATVTVSSNATGFIGANITFRNYWNTNALYNDALKITSSTQADAAYINADRSYFYNVTFTGYHDTLEAENGRQYYDHCYIEGRTDYIFGNTATCYFDGCIIHTIGSGSTTNGGYVMAIKGGTDSAHVDYGYVFDGCSFITDLEKYYKTDDDVEENEGEAGEEGDDEEEDDFQYTVEGTVSVARTWSGSNMHIAILNSTFDEGFSKKAYGDSSDKLNARYESMSGDAPNPEYLVEYNNSGEGAIGSSINGTCTVLADASGYTIANIFSTTNGGISYNVEWDPTSIEIITIDVEDGTGNTVTTIYATGSISVSDLIDAINARLSDFQVNDVYSDTSFTDTAVINSAVNETTTVYVKLVDRDMSVTKSSNWDFTNSNYGSGVTTSGYLDADEKLYLDLGTSGAFSVNGGYYVMTNDATISLILNPGSTLCVGTYTLDCLTATDGEGNAITLETSGGENNKSSYCYTNSTDGQVTVKLGVYTGESAKSLYFMYINVSVGVVTETTTYTFTAGVKLTSIEGCIGWYLDIKVDATSNGKFQLRGDGNADAQTNTGTILYIQSVPGAHVSFDWYPSYGASEDSEYVSVNETGLVTIQISPVNGSSAYIYSITVTVPTT